MVAVSCCAVVVTGGVNGFCSGTFSELLEGLAYMGATHEERNPLEVRCRVAEDESRMKNEGLILCFFR